jgi:hypothetical protein
MSGVNHMDRLFCAVDQLRNAVETRRQEDTAFLNAILGIFGAKPLTKPVLCSDMVLYVPNTPVGEKLQYRLNGVRGLEVTVYPSLVSNTLILTERNQHAR